MKAPALAGVGHLSRREIVSKLRIVTATAAASLLALSAGGVAFAGPGDGGGNTVIVDISSQSFCLKLAQLVPGLVCSDQIGYGGLASANTNGARGGATGGTTGSGGTGGASNIPAPVGGPTGTGAIPPVAPPAGSNGLPGLPGIPSVRTIGVPGFIDVPNLTIPNLGNFGIDLNGNVNPMPSGGTVPQILASAD